MRMIAFIAACMVPFSLVAQEFDAAIDAALDTHVLPGMERLAQEAADLSETAQTHCAVDAPELRVAYHAAFDAWIQVSHLRFGPSETDNRAFALAFWPDSRGVTPRTLAQLIGDERGRRLRCRNGHRRPLRGDNRSRRLWPVEWPRLLGTKPNDAQL